MKSREEVEKLKQLWLEDKTAFMLPEVEGYEDYREELEEFVEAETQKRQSSPDFGSLIANGLSSFLGGMVGNLGQPSMDNLKERIAFEVIQKLLEEKPVPIGRSMREKYYQNIGYEAYQRTHYILNGRRKFLAEDCNCEACRAKDQHPEEDS